MGLNPRASKEQLPAFAGIGEVHLRIFARAGGRLHFKARGFSPVFSVFLLLCLLFPLRAQTLPHFRTAADARAWGEARERARQYEAAASAYEVEAAIRQRTGDPQAAEIERRRAERLRTTLTLAITGPVPVRGLRLAKLEPVAGCYLGALDDYADHDRRR